MPSKNKIRSILLWLHRWAGALAGLVILGITVTGGILVFEYTLQQWLRPDLYPKQATAKNQRVPVAESLAMFLEKRPSAQVQGIRLPRDERDALVLFSGTQAAYFDPGSGEFLGERPRSGGWEQTMIKLHVNLQQGAVGGTIVVVTTGVIIGLALTGLWLWWPLRITGFRRGASFRRFNLDLHSVAGLYSSLFLLVISISGITLRYLHGEHPQPPPVIERGDHRITVDEAIRIAESALPGARAASLELPGPNPRAPFRVQLSFPEDGSPAGRSVAFLNPFTGDVLETHSSREGTLLEKYQMAQLSIHTGAIGGTVTRWIALLTCIALLLQVISGYVLWWKRPGSKTPEKIR